MKILLTGGAGFIGYHLTKLLVGKGHNVVVFDAFINYADPSARGYLPHLHKRLSELHDIATVIRGDVRDTGHLIEVMREHKPEVVLNLAAVPTAAFSNQVPEDAQEINLGGIVSILNAIRASNVVRRYVYVSSSFVYGNFQSDPASEDHPLDPIDAYYGGTKLAGEVLTKSFAKRFGLEYVIVRPSAVYGPTSTNNQVMQLFVENALKGEPLTLHDGGQGRVDFTYVEDLAQGMYLAITHPSAVGEAFNITRGEGRSMKELADVIGSIIPGVKTVVKPSDEVRPNRGSLDITKARTLLGYEPKFSLEDGMKKYIAYMKENNSGV